MKKIFYFMVVCFFCFPFFALSNGLSDLEKKANSGDPDAQFMLGWSYYRGLSFEQSDENARKYFKLACDNNLQVACSNLSKLDFDTKKRQRNEQLVNDLGKIELDFELTDDYKKISENAIKKLLKDPYSAKFSEISKPIKNVLLKKYNDQYYYGYSICVNVNAKNSYGSYSGDKVYGVLIKNNEVIDISENGDNLGISCL